MMLGKSLKRNGLTAVVAVATAYFVLAAAAIAFTRLSDNVALLWIANAPLLAALLTRPAAERPFHILACFTVTIAASLWVSPYGMLSPLFAVANVGEACVAWLMLRHFSADSRISGLRAHLACSAPSWGSQPR